MKILTFDIEDWYCHDCESGNKNWDNLEVRIYDGVDKILISLEEKNITASFFILGWLAEKHPSIIKKIVDAGHHIGCHTYQHDLLTNFNRDEFYQDTYKSKSLIEDVSGKQIDTFRAPAFSITKDNLFVYDVLGELGFRIDCSIFPAKRDFGGMPNYGEASPSIIKYGDYVFKEFPINPGKVCGKNIVFSGGGYFRLMPYNVIRNFTKCQNYTMTYFHPSDFDPDQPDMSHLSLRSRLKNRIGLKGAYSKYLKYLSDFDFVDIPTAIERIAWEDMPIIKLD